MAMKGYSAFPKSSSITGGSPSDCLVSYPGHSLRGVTPLPRSSRCILQPQPNSSSSSRNKHLACLRVRWTKENPSSETLDTFVLAPHISVLSYLFSFFFLKLATIVEGDPKAPFSIATTPRCRGGRYSIPRIAPLYPWTVPYNAEYQVSLVWLPGHWRTL